MTPAWVLPLLPELCLLVGACLVLLAGVSRGAAQRALVPLISLFAVAGALGATYTIGLPESGVVLPGIWLTSVTLYTRWISLSIGVFLIFLNWQTGEDDERGEFMAMILLSLLGLLLTSMANDWVVLLFAIELVSVPTYVMVALSRNEARASEAAVKYFFLGALSAALLAYGITFLYGATGTTTIYAVGPTGFTSVLAPHVSTSLVQVGLLLMFGGLAFKIAAVPFHVYAPDVYEGASASATALLGFVPKMAGFVALIQVFTACRWHVSGGLWTVLWIVAAVTMTAGNAMALWQTNVKRMLAYSSIAHTGYMLVALMVGPVAGRGPMHDGVAALFFYIAVYGVTNLGAFAMLSVLRVGDREAESLEDLSGSSSIAAGPAVAFAICLFGLMGFPLTAGLLGKIYVFSSAFSVGGDRALAGPLMALAILGVINSAIGAAYYLRAAGACFLGTTSGTLSVASNRMARVALAASAIVVVALFVSPASLARPARQATAIVRHLVGDSGSRQAANDDRLVDPVVTNLTATAER